MFALCGGCFPKFCCCCKVGKRREWEDYEDGVSTELLPSISSGGTEHDTRSTEDEELTNTSTRNEDSDDIIIDSIEDQQLSSDE